MAAIDPNVIEQLNRYAIGSVDNIFRESEQKIVKPLDSAYGDWVFSKYKADIKDLQGFKAVAKWFQSRSSEILEQRAQMRAKAPAEQYTYVWKAVEKLFNAKIDALEKTPKEVKNYLYIQMIIRMARLYYKIVTTDMTSPDKQLKALLDETKNSFAEIKKKMPSK